MAKPFPTIETQRVNRNPTGKNPPIAVVPNLTLSVPFADIPNDPIADIPYTFTVLRQGGNTGISDCDWDIVPAAGSPIPAAYFGGTYPNGQVHLITSQGQQSVTFMVPAGVDAAADLFADIILSNFVGCKPGAVTTVRVRSPGVVAAADYVVSVDVPVVNLVRDDTSDHAYTVNVTRIRSDGDYSGVSTVQLKALGSGATPFQASDFTGGLLNQLVTFAAGQTAKTFTILVKAGTDPATDLTGDISISVPTNCLISPIASTVPVKIPKAVVIVQGVLPPQYTDPNFNNMTPYSPKPTTFAALQTACAALSNSAQCKTKYIELDPSYNDTGTRNLPYKGYIDPSSGLIYPLIIAGNPAKAKSRTTADINNRPHFRHFTLNGASWLWLYALAAEFPTGAGDNGMGQADVGAAIFMDGSSDCFITRCWLDAPWGAGANTATRPRIGANDFYGTRPPNVGANHHLYFNCLGQTPASQRRSIGVLAYQNFHGQCRAPATLAGKQVLGGAIWYTGDGVSPDISAVPNYPNIPYDLNMRESWYFNNLMINIYSYNIYNKHATNVWRNRVVSTNVWTDTTGTGQAWHFLAGRGGNYQGGTFKYNVVEGQDSPYSSHNDMEGWDTVWEFNDFGGVHINVFMHCHDPAKLPDGRYSKTLLDARHARFRGNKNGNYKICAGRGDTGYTYYADLQDVIWEGEVNATWKWAYDPSGSPTFFLNPTKSDVAWHPTTHKNTETCQIKFGAGGAFHLACAAGQLTNLPNTAVQPQLTLAYAANGFTKAEKGIPSQEGIVWDGVGDGGTQPGDPDPTLYRLTSDNFTLHFPSDDMPTDYPNCSLIWLPGGGFECKAGLGSVLDGPGKHACLNLWMKNAPPHGDATFTYYFTRLDNLTATDSEGIFTLLRERFKGTSAYGTDPNGWAPASWRVNPSFPTPGSDSSYRERGTGYRNSFANRNLIAPSTMQFRLRTYNGVIGDTGTVINDTTGYTTDNVNGGSTFDFPLNVKCKVEVARTGNSIIAKRTRVDNGVVQEWDWTDNMIGTSGRGVDGWCGFGFYLGMWGRVEPVPGVPFCQ